MDTATDRWIDEKEASRLTGFSRYAFQAWRFRGNGPPFRKLGLGRRGPVRYLLSDLMKWMERYPTLKSTSEYETKLIETPVGPTLATPPRQSKMERVVTEKAKRISNEVLVALGEDYIAGWRARRNGEGVDIEQSRKWRDGWLECHAVIRDYEATRRAMRARE